MKEAAFWDASAIVPLCLDEPTSSVVAELARSYGMQVWWGTPVEIRSAIAREQRFGRLDANRVAGALEVLTALSRGWSESAPADDIRDLAGELLAEHPLRAADSLQLAAALIWCDQVPKPGPFISGDERLCEAARSVGFDVISIYAKDRS